MDKKKILLVTIGHLSLDINGGALPATLPYLRTAHNLDYQATGALMMAYSIMSSLIQPFFGLLADRHSKPWFMPLGVILAGCGLAIMGFMESYWAIFAGIAISGIGSSFFHPEAARYANKVSGSQKGVGLSLFSIGGNSGFIIGPLLVTLFVGTFNLHGMLAFGILGLLMGTILFWRISLLPVNTAQIPQSLSQKQLRKDAEISGADPQQAEADEMLLTGSSSQSMQNNWREFSKLLVIIVCRSMTFVGCNTFIPLYWVNAFGQSKSMGAMALVVFGACGVGFNLLGGFLSDKFGYVTMIRVAFFLMAPVVLTFGLVDNIWFAWCMLPFLGLALYLSFSSQVVLGQKLLAKNMGFASGITLGVSSTLGGIAQPCLGWLADGWGLHSVFICLACLGALGATFSCFLNKENDIK